jgi:two-component system response regulator NreC
MSDTIRVLLADDNVTLREQFQRLIATAPGLEVVGVAGDGRAAVAGAQALRPDVVVMDLSMPVLNGLEATRQLRESCPNIRVVALTTHEDLTYVAAMQAAGASGYVLKHSGVAVLLGAIRTVAAGKAFLDPALAKTARPATAAPPPVPDLSPELLTAKERAVLQHTARGLTTQQVAGAVGDDVAGVVETRRRAMARLGLESRVALVHYAMRHGSR